MTRVRDITILGVHPVKVSKELFGETLEFQWGAGLAGDALRHACNEVAAHFDSLYLIEVQVHPPNATVEWAKFTQVQADLPRSNWQVPYDEQAVDESRGRWGFFLHFVDPSQPLETPAGARALPPTTACPPHLGHLVYEPP